ncbi:MAG: type II/IV secretion system protein [Gammaproteobacteria bacterium]|nr:MAG: type II/IV secretion system protein [Gammaproteobacteria bacterium]
MDETLTAEQAGKQAVHLPQRFVLAEVLDALVADGILREADARLLKSVSAASTGAGRHPFVIIADRGWRHASEPDRALTMDDMVQWLAQGTGLPIREIDPLRIDAARATGIMSHAYARRFGLLPLEVHDDHVVIGVASPETADWMPELERVLGKRIERVIVAPDEIEHYLDEFYALSHSVLGAHAGQNERLDGVQNLEQLVEMGRKGQLDANDQHVVTIVDWLLQYAYEQRASDIHLEPRREQGQVRFRIDGVLHPVYQFPPSVMGAVTSRLKILGRMDVAEKRRPQDGRIKTRTPGGSEIELRLSTMPTAFGEKLVLRIFDPEVMVRDFSELGFARDDLQRWEALGAQPNGIVLVTGPTGSGKTTTLYSTLLRLARPEVNVCTVEDPIEMVEPRLNQMQVQPAIGVDFASGIRTLMRQDPDIIMVGEIRDLETAEMAIQAALTGHLVFATLHTNDAPSAITRLLELGVAPYLLRATLLGVLAQRLVRTLCPACKRPQATDERLWQSLVRPWNVKPPEQVFEPEGCPECRHTGYRGRIGIYELLTVIDRFKSSVGPDTDLAELRRLAMAEGMKTLRLDGARKVGQGLTSIGEVLRVTPAGSA